MGWNTSVLFRQGVTADEAVDDLAITEFSGELVEAGQATGALKPEALYAADPGGWAQVWNPMMDLVMGWEPTDPGTALVVFFSSASSTYGFTLFTDGERIRHYVYADGVAVEDEGTPLPAEAEVPVPSWGPDEDFLWSIITAVTGLRYDAQLRYRVYPV
ncbi:hypothetical protein GCM10010172_02630 [Paractinoplanes ferrugineus]|uniref:Uncharacterized protein n=1 Tax=Paractinoplanes ferrugineus TaxID=113564 RepID=A0A919MFC9_9ACTN|nr:hypothetical protein [Actinoplanes ferrugineus]GIE13668.1 hypothetical protein Afe05nite_55080 [Actinoplanes ferrugineus]